YALLMLSSLYYGLFFAVYLLPVTAVLWIAHRRPRRAIWALAAGAALAFLFIAPVAMQYVRNKPMLGERPAFAIAYYSATPSDYLHPHLRVRWYTRFSGHGHPEREIFPGIAAVVLAAVALWPPVTAARIAYACGLAVAFDGSLGLNGLLYPLLHD